VFECLTGDRGHCRNAGEDDPLLGLARLIRRPGEIHGASRRRRGHTRAKVGSASAVPNRLRLPRGPTGRSSLLSIPMCKEGR